MKALYARNFFFENIVNAKEKRFAVKLFIESLLEKLFGKNNKQLLNEMIDLRWVTFAHLFQELDSFKDPSFCDFSKTLPETYWKTDFEADLKFAIQHFINCQSSEVSIDSADVVAIRELELADFIETIAQETIGAENVFTFLKHCF